MVLSYESIGSFDMSIAYAELTSTSKQNTFEHHIHDECEIYFNLSGEVSFAVEDSIYPIIPGSIIITRPHEYHHCIYHSDKPHKHFWILIQSDNNKGIFDPFYNRELGKNNLIVLDPREADEFRDICVKLSVGCKNEIDKYECFFRLIRIIDDAETLSAPKSTHDNIIIDSAVKYINSDFSSKITVGDVAKKFNISISTLERYFMTTFNLTPREYIKNRRFANAIKMLSEGCSVTEAAYQSGFCDCASFVASFKKKYSITPLKYQKLHSKSKQG